MEYLNSVVGTDNMRVCVIIWTGGGAISEETIIERPCVISQGNYIGVLGAVSIRIFYDCFNRKWWRRHQWLFKAVVSLNMF